MNTVKTKQFATSTTKFVSQTELDNILSDFLILDSSSTFASVLQLTAPKTTVKCRDSKIPFNGMIEKLSQVNILLNSEYAVRVLNQLGKEEKPKEDYKQGINTMPLEICENNNFFGTFNNKGVIRYSPNPNPKLKSKVQYYLNGKKVEKSSLPNVLPTVRKATNQGTSKEIIWRKLYTTNIIQITIGGMTYQRL